VAPFGAGVFDCEHPIDASLGDIALSLPGSDLEGEALWIVDALNAGTTFWAFRSAFS